MNLKINMSRGKSKDYQFGFSTTDDIATVTNWQIGNNTFLNVPDGTYYLFAKPINGSEDDYISLRIAASCSTAGCQIISNGIIDLTPICQISTDGYRDISAGDTVSYQFTAILNYGN